MLVPITRKITCILAAAALIGCSGSVEISGSGGAGGEPATTTSTTIPTSGDSTSGGPWTVTAATTGSGNPQAYACSGPDSAPPATACTPQDPGCNPGKSACAANQVAGGAPSFALRIAHLDFSKPAALATGIGKTAVTGWLGPAPPICQIPSFTLAWLLRFNLYAGTLSTGGAVQGTGEGAGFKFITATLDTGDAMGAVMPATGPIALESGCDLDVTVGDVNVPIMYNPGSPGNVYLPFRQLRFFGGKVTPDHNCIGTYADDKLSPANGCAPPKGTSPYDDGAMIHALFNLEEADKILIDVAQESLCVFLAQDAATYGTQDGQFKHCTRDAGGKIIFQGDYCAATNQSATPGCADAVEVLGTFAAAGAKMVD